MKFRNSLLLLTDQNGKINKNISVFSFELVNLTTRLFLKSYICQEITLKKSIKVKKVFFKSENV